MTWRPGKKIYNSRYTIERELGEGGFGITYLAQDSNGQKVVIKTPNNQTQILPKFEDEARRLKQCQHPNIVKYYELFKDDNLWCIAMEYIEGENLATIVQRDGILQEKDALKYIKQIANALKVVHDNGILHRDIKPENIIKRKNQPEVVLIDFGIARDFTPNQSNYHTQYVTSGFAPIEQYIDRFPRGEYTDVYALAATLYVLLTGYYKISQGIYSHHLPNANDRINAIAHRKPDPLRLPKEINKNVSSKVNEAILKGMILEYDKRPKTVAEWLNLLPNTNIVPSKNITEFLTKIVAPINKKNNIKTEDFYISSWMILVSTLVFLPVLYYFAPSITKVPTRPVVNYGYLQQLLSNQKFEDADKETLQVMLTLAERKGEQWFNEESFQNIYCNDLHAIDKLWTKYSNGHFGFSIQKKIWQEVVNQHGVDEKSIRENFLDRVGWRVNDNLYKNITYNLSAPPGHLPYRVTSRIGNFGVHPIAEKLTRCNSTF